MRVNNQSFYASSEPVPWAMSADVLFKDSVGRTDLPGGDETQMRHSLRTISNALDPTHDPRPRPRSGDDACG